jgi:hypothetical protein
MNDPYNRNPFKRTQHQRILGYLEKYHSITLLECMDRLKITKLQTRLGELRKKGYIFPERREGNGPTRYKRYFKPTRIPRALTTIERITGEQNKETERRRVKLGFAQTGQKQ